MNVSEIICPIRFLNFWEIELDISCIYKQLNIPIMSKEMNWDTFVPTREIREYDRKLRESVRQREQLKQELAELEQKPRDIFWDVEYAMFSAGLKYFNTCSEYWLYKVESEYINVEKEYLNSQE